METFYANSLNKNALLTIKGGNTPPDNPKPLQDAGAEVEVK
ncbi:MULTISPECIES: hypothetical protein [unclassified Flavobacterium]